ncbi:MAG TPA: AtpZ/AtpI family protein, partial [Candidatus Limnocylindrales bacterium]
SDRRPRSQLLYSRRLGRSSMIEPGRGWAYFALFSEIGIALLVATLAGALGGVWLDRQVGTTPLFVLIGLFVGLAAGARIAYRLINRFLAQAD